MYLVKSISFVFIYHLTSYDENGDKIIDDNEKTSYDEISNPLTYRGYCYDYDIELYYLQSRYYDPETCRFINADSTDYLGTTGTLLSYNLFAYCENDPVNYVDPSGCYKDYAFTIIPGMTHDDMVYAIAKDLESSPKTTVRASFSYVPLTPIKEYHYNATVSRKFSSTGIYVDFLMDSPLLSDKTRFSTYYNKKTYIEWLLYIEERHKTLFNKIEDAAMDILDVNELQWDVIKETLYDIFIMVGQEKIAMALAMWDVIVVISEVLTVFFDKVDNYIMAILNRRPKLVKSTYQIAIMWSITQYTNKQFYNGVMQKGWKTVKTYYAWEL